MFADGYGVLLARIEATSTEGRPSDVLHRAAHLSFDFCVEDPARYQLLFLRTIPGFTPSVESDMLAKTVIVKLTGVLRAAGACTPEQVDLWTALFTGLASQQISTTPAATDGTDSSTSPSTCSSNGKHSCRLPETALPNPRRAPAMRNNSPTMRSGRTSPFRRRRFPQSRSTNPLRPPGPARHEKHGMSGPRGHRGTALRTADRHVRGYIDRAPAETA